MARQLEERLFGQFRGVRHRGSFLPISEVFSVVGSRNFWHSEPNAITAIPGYQQLANSSVIADPVRQLFWYSGRPPAGAVNQLLVAYGDRFDEVINIETGDLRSISVGDIGVNDFVQIAQARERLYIASGEGAPIYFYEAGGTPDEWGPVTNEQPPPPTLSIGANDGDVHGEYRARYSYLYDAPRAPGVASEASLPLVVDGKQLDVLVTASPDPDWSGTDVWVNPPESPYYYLAGTLQEPDVTFELDFSSAELVVNSPELERHGDPPPVGAQHVAYARNRLMVANWPGEESTVAFSDVNEVESFSNGLQLRVAPGDGDEIRAIVVGRVRPGETTRNLLATVFKTQSIYNLLDTGEQISNISLVEVEKTRSNVGCIAPNTVLQAPIDGQHMYVFLASDGTIRVFDGQDSVDISEPVRDYLEQMNLSAAPLSWGVYAPELKLLVWQIPIGGSTVPNFALGWHLESGAWVPLPDWRPFRSGTLFVEPDDGQRFYNGAASDVDSGQFPIFRQFFGTSFDAAPITWQWRSKPLLSEEGGTFTFEYIEPIAVAQDGAELRVRAWRGFDDPDLVTAHFDQNMALTTDQKTHVHETLILENAEGDFMVDQEATFQFEQTTAAESAKVLGFRLGVRRKARKRFGR